MVSLAYLPTSIYTYIVYTLWSFDLPPGISEIQPLWKNVADRLTQPPPMSDPTQSQAQAASTSSFVAALVLNAAVFGAEILAFTLLRKRFKTIYEPRTFLTPQSKRVPPLPQPLLSWPLAIWNSDPEIVRKQNGLDAYMFLRFLRMLLKIIVPIWVISWAVLLPVTSVGTSVPGRTGLDRFTFGNVAPNATARYAAHLTLAYLFTGYILYTLNSELQLYISIRQRHLISDSHSSTAQASTILITGVPRPYLSTRALTHLFSHIPGGVRRVWLNHDLQSLPDVHDTRLSACNKLESAEYALLTTAQKIYKQRAGKTPAKVADAAAPDVELAPEDADRIVPRDKRPSHRLPIGFLPFSLPLVGKKVDTIEWARAEIVRTNGILERAKEVIDAESEVHSSDEDSQNDGKSSSTYPPLSSAFILFHEQIGAHIAAKTLTHDLPLRMTEKYTEVAPADVVWGNLGLNPYEARVRQALSWAMTIGLIIVWAIPVAFIGIVSNIAALCSTYKWLAWLCTIPAPVRGIIQGILPPVLLAILFMLLPIILRLLARFEGIPTRVGIELSLMDRFFVFLVIHGFLIVTISSGIIAALPGLLHNPGSIPTLLAQKLPDASTFFLTYIILQGLSGTSGGFLTIVPLILYYVKLILLGSTPRSVYNIRYNLRRENWGTLWPGVSLLIVITLGYSIISPIINGLAAATFFLFYMLYKYLFTYQFDFPPSTDSGGLFFPRAVGHVFVGVYVQQLCLCALFFLAQNEHSKPAAVPEGVLMIVLIVITAFYHNLVSTSYAPLLTALPLTLADKSHGMPKAGGDGAAGGGAGDNASATTGAEPDVPPEQRHPLADEDTAPSNTDTPSDFVHPALRDPQPTVWVAADGLGLGIAEVRAMREEGISATVGGARMDKDGDVVVWGVGDREK